MDDKGYGVFPGVFMAESIEELKKECSERVIPLQVSFYLFSIIYLWNKIKKSILVGCK